MADSGLLIWRSDSNPFACHFNLYEFKKNATNYQLDHLGVRFWVSGWNLNKMAGLYDRDGPKKLVVI